MAPGPQLGDGLTQIKKGSKVVGYMVTKYTANGFREVIVGKRYKLKSLPLELATYTLVGQQGSPQSDPQAAAAWCKQQLGGGSNYEYYWVTSDSPSDIGNNYSNPPSGYSYVQTAGAKDGNSDTVAVWSEWIYPSSGYPRTCHVAHAVEDGADVDVATPDGHTFSNLTPGSPPTTGSAIGVLHGGHISPYDGYEFTETIEERDDEDDYPQSW